MIEILKASWEYLYSINLVEAVGLVLGIACVWLLIKENIWTWPLAILYVLISLAIYWKSRLYADFGLHILYLGFNSYGWYSWAKGEKSNGKEVPLRISHTGMKQSAFLLIISFLGIIFLGTMLDRYTDADLAYWDSVTTVLSLTGMWLTARKRIDNWYYWLVVDILATGIYYYKELYFFSLLYLIYVGMAVAGYLSWKKSWEKEQALVHAS